MPTKVETVDLIDDFMETSEKTNKRQGVKVAKKKVQKNTQQMGTVGSRIDTGLKKVNKPKPVPVTTNAQQNIVGDHPITVENLQPQHNVYKAGPKDSARDSSVQNTDQNQPSEQ